MCCCDGHCQLRNGSRNCNCNGRCRLPKVRKTGCCFRPIVFSVYTYNNHLTSCFADTLHPIFSYTITRAFVSLRTGWIAIQLCGEMRPNSDGIANLRLGSRFFYWIMCIKLIYKAFCLINLDKTFVLWQTREGKDGWLPQ